ncbi:MAG: DUF1330 domain-containing protein [Dechloromonas sp.]|nr:DUF1330 domain-containing protein [Dechloromonas sp.]
MSQKGYLIAEAKVGDAEAYEIYKALAQAAIAEHGGRYLVRGGAAEILEGKWVNVPRLVLIPSSRPGGFTIRRNTRLRVRLA